MRTSRSKQGEVVWPRMVASKWLRLRFGGGEKFNFDAKDEDEPFKRSQSQLMRGQSMNCVVDNEEYRIFVGTWNVGGKRAQDDLDLEVENWLHSTPETESSDIYVIGFQEIVPLKAGKVFGTEDSRAAEKWDTLIRKTLNRNEVAGIMRSVSAPPSEFAAELPLMQQEKDSAVSSWSRERYERVASKQMVGILITIWVKSEVRRNIRDVKVSCVGCGIMGCLGNKGSVSVSLLLHHTSFCFVCTHLASGQKEGDEIRRNSDIAEIMKRSHFPRDSAFLPQTIMEHDRIIWFGDLNYRFTLSDSEIIMSLIDKNDWETLQRSDQLKIEQNSRRIFEGWQEGHIDFAPTYKYAANSDQYCATQNKPGEKCRIPAWCDRILWHGRGLKQVSYERGEIILSDHRPVSAIFTTQIKSIHNRQLKKKMALPFKCLLEAEDLLSAEIQMLHPTPTHQPEVDCNELISLKPENMQLDLLPVLTTMEARSSLNIELKPYEYDFKASSPSITQAQIVVSN